jgi:DNA-binding MarR family transcriptional regulator
MAPDSIDRIKARTGRKADDAAAVEVIGRLYRLTGHLDRLLGELFARHGLTRGEFGVLSSLLHAGEPSLTPGRLAAQLICSSGAMTNRLDRLEADGLIVRTPDPEDRRGTRISITKAGRLRVQAATAERDRLDPELVPGLSAAERRELVKLLRKVLVAHEARTEPVSAR